MFEFIVKKRVFFGFVFAVLFLVFSRPTLTTVLAGIPFGVAGLGIRAWSSGLIRKNKALATDGPYAMTRNPLYVGSFIAGFGVALMGGSIPLLLVFVVAYLTVYDRIIKNEEAYLKTVFPQELEVYMGTVPRFFPDVRKFRGSGEYNFELMWKKHKEWQAWLGLLAVTGLLLAKALGAFAGIPYVSG
jgi:protein-S-isoprenylcysteine O-methyltransferase Ste14